MPSFAFIEPASPLPLTILVGAAIKRFGLHAIAHFGVSQHPYRVVGIFAQILDGDVLIC